VDLELNEDQRAILDGAEALLEKYVDLEATSALGEAGHCDDALRTALDESGFLELGLDDETGWLEATQLVEATSRACGLIDIGAAALVAPATSGRAIPGPVALVEQGHSGPVRFGAQARSALIDRGDEAFLVVIDPDEQRAVETNYPWPIGRLPEQGLEGESLGPGSGERMRRFWRLAIAAECIGAMQAALDTTVEYLKQRRQFGRAIGTFQALQHRCAEMSVMIEGGRWLVYEAAYRRADAQSAAAAAAHVTNSALRVLVDTHQLTGAMGYTREHPLHLWTMRLPVLRLELGGARRHRIEAARARWGSGPPALA
jgi:alkylation response protein AidB-like acyl-CoA dehydrogenase